jgi:N-acetylmuramoyl-L-alanine amidase
MGRALGHEGGSGRGDLLRPGGAALAILPLVLVPVSGAGAPRIVDYQKNLSPRFVKRVRRDTRFIIVHSTECHLSSALRTLSRGKVRRGRYITRGGHAHYLVARDGTLYRILDPRYRADHAGVSMWNGVENLSDHSLGIELEGYHDTPFTSAQYDTLRWLLGVLRKRYGIASRDVLEHCRVAYTHPNRFYRRSWRGRKQDPGLDNFDRQRAGLDDEYAYDPDVAAGRLGGERTLARAVRGHAPAVVPAVAARRPPEGSIRAEVILPGRTAWSIAGTAHHAASTLYVFPDGSARTGDQIPEWNDLPVGTEVYLDLPSAPTGVLSKDQTAWRIAGGDYDSETTLYYFPEGRVLRGDEITDWSNLASGTAVYVNVPDQPET